MCVDCVRMGGSRLSAEEEARLAEIMEAEEDSDEVSGWCGSGYVLICIDLILFCYSVVKCVWCDDVL